MADTKRLEAAKRGERKFLGSACVHGHDGWRYTSNGVCIACTKVFQKLQHEEIRRLLQRAK